MVVINILLHTPFRCVFISVNYDKRYMYNYTQDLHQFFINSSQYINQILIIEPIWHIINSNFYILITETHCI